MTGRSRIRVGIIGLNAQRGWAFDAHLPALRALVDDYEITAVCTSRCVSAKEAAEMCGIRHAFNDPVAMAQHPDVDLVVVAVKVPQHDVLVRAGLNAGKHVYCEWPLAMDVGEADALAQLAMAKGVRHFTGLQTRAAPTLQYVKRLIADGFVGAIRSSSVVASGMVWGPYIDAANAYVLDKTNRVTMETVPFGHFIDVFTQCLGGFRYLSATRSCFYDQAMVIDRGESVTKTASDQLVVQGMLESDAVVSIHYRGGISAGTNFRWEINGTEGDLLLEAGVGHVQFADVILRGARGQGVPLAELTIPDDHVCPQIPRSLPYNVGHLYAALAPSLRNPQCTPPGWAATFSDAVAVHRLIEAVERAADSGGRVTPS